ncbi:MAG TPA: DoxX family protein [Azospirillaceae bacterium]|nr:DoxX family protein [Azospirillaceae bacterium]
MTLYRNPGLAALLLRLSLGVMYLTHAGLKVFTFGMPAAAAFFEAQGFPAWSVWIVVPAEVLGGLMLIAGLWTGPVVLALLPVLAGAAWVHLGNGWVFTAPGGGWEYPVFLMAMSLVQLLLGDGPRLLGAAAPRRVELAGS